MAFYGCNSINSISIPETVLDLESWGIFTACNNLETIYSYMEKPAKMSDDAFMLSDGANYSNATLHVPYGTRSEYKSTDGWKNLKNIVEMSSPTFEIKTSSAGYATFYSSESAYTLPNGLTGQVVCNATNSKLTYKTIADGAMAGVVPKGTAVMLVSDNKRSGTYTLTATESSASYSGTNLLRGSDEAQMTTGNGYHYKLSYGKSGTSQSDVFGWYWGADNGGSFMTEGHKVWLVVPKSAATTRSFTVDGEVAGISTLEVSEEDAVYYDLQGRRVTNPTVKGVYIKNGKKIMVK